MARKGMECGLKGGYQKRGVPWVESTEPTSPRN